MGTFLFAQLRENGMRSKGQAFASPLKGSDRRYWGGRVGVVISSASPNLAKRLH
jgi:hypothetical protein